MPVILTFWGKEENREAVHNQMTRCGFRLGTDLKGFFFCFYSVCMTYMAFIYLFTTYCSYMIDIILFS